MLLLLAACKPEESPPATPPADVRDPVAAYCAHVRAGPSGPATNAALSELHAAVRLFEPSKDFRTADDALATVLAEEDALASPDLVTYGDLVGGCGLPADDTPLGPASVTLVDADAWVVPGTGVVTLPGGARSVVIDLRDLPNVPELRAALTEAVSPALATAAVWPTRDVRQWDGFVDQFYAESNAYTTEVVEAEGEEIPATGTEDLPIWIVTGERMAPAASELAIGLRAAGRASILGADVDASAAESRWYAHGDMGVTFRAARILDADGEPVPDTVVADIATDDPESASREGVPGPLEGDVARDGIHRRSPWGEEVSTSHDLGTTRAALFVAHGTVRTFFPYFDVVGDTIDSVLDNQLDGLDPDDRCDVVRRLGWLSVALSDGHVFFGDLDTEAGCNADVAGYLGVVVMFIDGEPVVTQTAYDDVSRGDTIVAMDGVSVAELMDESLSWHGAATEGYRRDLAFRALRVLRGPVLLTLRDPDGVDRDVTVDPVDVDTISALPYTEATRADGTLDDLGAPDIAYINLDSSVTTDLSQVTDTLALAGDAGVVVDMRGYPGINHYSVLDALIPGAYQSPVFTVATWTGPDSIERVSSQYDLEGDATAYAGPIVLLVHPTTVSAAENFSMMLTGAGRVSAVIGEQSAGTNGNITGPTLPGDFYFSFTGMQVLFPDGSPFHGIGIVPDVEVVPMPADLRDGTDPVLMAAIAALGG